MQQFLKLGIIGHPLTHTLSPLLHTELLRIMGLDGEYRAYELPPEILAESLSDLAGRGLRGLNVTIPHKVAVMPLLDWMSPEAHRIGAVNTIVFEDSGRIAKGHNTDIEGFTRSLPTDITGRLGESHVMILGAGGSSRAVLAGLIRLGTAEITIAARNLQKAADLAAHADLLKEAYQEDTTLHVSPWDTLIETGTMDGIINTTPIGMWPATDETPLEPVLLEKLSPGAFVYDLVYRPLETRLVADARSIGLHGINGLDMLLHQGIAAFELWQDQPVPPDSIPALRNHLIHALEQVPS